MPEEEVYFAFDEILQDSGSAPWWYAEQLLGMVEPEWRQPGGDVTGLVDVAAHRIVREPPGLELRSPRGYYHPMERSDLQARPIVAVNCPDGYGNPRLVGPPSAAPPGTAGWRWSLGVLAFATFGIRRASRGRTVLHGGCRLEVRVPSYARHSHVGGAHHGGPRPLHPGWRDRTFLKQAAALYGWGKWVADKYGPTHTVWSRATSLIRTLAESRQDLLAKLVSDVFGRTIRAYPGGHVEAYETVRKLAEDRDVPGDYEGELFHPMGGLGTGLAPEAVAAWHAFLDDLERELGVGPDGP